MNSFVLFRALFPRTWTTVRPMSILKSRLFRDWTSPRTGRPIRHAVRDAASLAGSGLSRPGGSRWWTEARLACAMAGSPVMSRSVGIPSSAPSCAAGVKRTSWTHGATPRYATRSDGPREEVKEKAGPSSYKSPFQRIDAPAGSQQELRWVRLRMRDAEKGSLELEAMTVQSRTTRTVVMSRRGRGSYFGASARHGSRYARLMMPTPRVSGRTGSRLAASAPDRGDGLRG